MNALERKNDVPNNLPHNNEDISVNISKNKLKIFGKIVIIVVIILISAPRIINNINSTLNFVGAGTEKFSEIFPGLTTAGKTIGSIISNSFKGIGGNLASVGELLYTKKNEEPISEIEISEKEKPIKIIIDKVGINSIVLNPESADIDVLEESLKHGTVRYPQSALMGENDNVYIFGHSTNVSAVNNQAYKALNGLNKLEIGDLIKIQSSNKEYLYRVTSSAMKKNSEAVVEFNKNKKMLTLSTCNTLGAKEDRYIIEADFITSYEITSETRNMNLSENNTNSTTITRPLSGSSATATITTTPTSLPITAGTMTTNTYITTPIATPNNPNGKVDLETKITEIGILNSNNNFVASTTPSAKNKIAFKFTITNQGNKKAEGWSFNAVLPTTPLNIFHSVGQPALNPGEKIEYVLSFDKAKIGNEAIIIVNADPTGGLNEANKDNNIAKKIINITE